MTSHKQALEKLKDALVSELESLGSSSNVVTLDQQALGRVSRIDAIQQQEMAKSNTIHAQKHLEEVEHALKRLAEDEYGYCEECGKDISAGRLDIQPEARFCIDCQSQHEKHPET